MSLSPTLHLSTLTSLTSPLLPKKHPLDNIYPPQLTFTYTPSQATPQIPFMEMFLFPEECRLKNKQEREQWHAFIVTDETGQKYHGVCVTIYEPIVEQQQSEYKQIAETWTRENYTTDEIEHACATNEKLQNSQKQLEELRKSCAEDEDVSPAQEAQIFELEEAIVLYTSLLAPYSRAVTSVENIHVPKAIAIVCKWPFYTLFKDYLSVIVARSIIPDMTSLQLSIERYITNICNEIPLPPPGKFEVAIGIDELRLHIWRPPLNCLPIIQNYSIYPIFRCLSVGKIVEIFEHLLLERKLIVVSEHYSLLTIAIETFLALIFPLKWQHILIPILPARLMTYLQAPMPYIIGIHASYRHLEDPPADAMVVNLDNNSLVPPETAKAEITSPSLAEAPSKALRIPDHHRTKLLARLRKSASHAVNGPPRHYINLFPTTPSENKRLVLDSAASLYGTGRFAGKYVWGDTQFQRLVGDTSGPPVMKGSRPLPKRLSRTSVCEEPGRKSASSSMIPPVSEESLEKLSSNENVTDRSLAKELSVQSAPVVFSSSSTIQDTASSINTTEVQPPNDPVNATEDKSSGEGSLRNSEGSMVTVDLGLEAPAKPKKSKTRTAEKWIAQNIKQLGNSTEKGVSVLMQAVNSMNSPPEEPRERKLDRSMSWRSGPTALTSAFKHRRASAVPVKPVPQAEQAIPIRIERRASHIVGPRAYVSRPTTASTVTTSEPNTGTNTGESSAITSPVRALPSKPREIVSNVHDLNGFSGLTLSKSFDVGTDEMRMEENPEQATMPSFERHEGHLMAPISYFAARDNNADDAVKSCVICYQEAHFKDLLLCVSCKIGCHVNCRHLIFHPCPTVFDSVKVQDAFTKCMASMLKNYRNYLTIPTTEDAEIFRQKEFLASQVDFNARRYMSAMVTTQQFCQFLVDRVEKSSDDFEILYFDECVKAKLNRSRFKLTKDATPFLEDSAYSIKSLLAAELPQGTPVVPAEMKAGEQMMRFPDTFDSSLIDNPAPRAPKPLINEADNEKLQAHTSAMTREARLLKARAPTLSKMFKSGIFAVTHLQSRTQGHSDPLGAVPSNMNTSFMSLPPIPDFAPIALWGGTDIPIPYPPREN